MRNYDDDLRKIWKNKNKILLVFLIFVSFSIYIVYATVKKDNKTLDEFKERYRYIEETDSFDGKVQAINCFKGASEVSLTNGDEFVLSTSRNYDYEIFLMCCFINIGDSIIKKSNNDSIFVFRGENKYYFIHGEFIGKKNDSKFYRDPCK